MPTKYTINLLRIKLNHTTLLLFSGHTNSLGIRFIQSSFFKKPTDSKEKQCRNRGSNQYKKSYFLIVEGIPYLDIGT